MNNDQPQVLRQGNNWKKLYFYHKCDAIYQLTFTFCNRFLPKHGDRTVDQMVQAARSGKQNIVEGSEDGKTSTEMELKLVNVARASIGELTEDYKDYAVSRNIMLWKDGHPRFKPMMEYCRTHNNAEDYMPYSKKWTAEEYCNILLTLCYQVDKMMNSYLAHLDKTFVTEGGIKERMYAARTGYRKGLDEKMRMLETENNRLKEENAKLKAAVSAWQAKYNDLRQRAVKAYHDLKGQLEEAKKKEEKP